jgi:hypothetical protein
MGVLVRPLGLAVAVVRPVRAELLRKLLDDEKLLRERRRQGDTVFVGQRGVRRQRQDDLAGDLGVLALLRRLRGISQHHAVGHPRPGFLRQQRLVALAWVAMLEVTDLAAVRTALPPLLREM